MVVASVTAFHVLGGLLAVWAVTLTAIGIRSERFPKTAGAARLVGVVSVLLALSTISAGIIVAANEEEEGGESEAEAKPAPPPEPSAGGGGELKLAADPSGALKFDKKKLETKAGAVTIAMRNVTEIPHDVAIEGHGVNEKGKVVSGGGTSTVSADLKTGEYTFYCSVDAHRQAGMVGTLTVGP
jgi:plastocyanin